MPCGLAVAGPVTLGRIGVTGGVDIGIDVGSVGHLAGIEELVSVGGLGTDGAVARKPSLGGGVHPRNRSRRTLIVMRCQPLSLQLPP